MCLLNTKTTSSQPESHTICHIFKMRLKIVHINIVYRISLVLSFSLCIYIYMHICPQTRTHNTILHTLTPCVVALRSPFIARHHRCRAASRRRRIPIFFHSDACAWVGLLVVAYAHTVNAMFLACCWYLYLSYTKICCIYVEPLCVNVLVTHAQPMTKRLVVALVESQKLCVLCLLKMQTQCTNWISE